MSRNRMGIETFDIERGVTSFSQKNYVTSFHAHYAIELNFAVSGSISISTRNQSYTNIQGAIIAPKTRHAFDCLKGSCQLFFIDPATTVGEYFLDFYHLGKDGICVLDTSEVNKFKKGTHFSIPDITKTRQNKRDGRILKCIQLIDTHINNDLSVAKLAEMLFLSESRLAHLFKEQMGISIRQYILWKKIGIATKKSQEGYSLTECAHFAGFSDSSHFSRSFMRMFGVSPFFALKS